MTYNRLSYGSTQAIDSQLDVHERLRKLHQWEDIWRARDKVLDEMIRNIDDTKPLELQRSSHLIMNQKRQQIQLVPEPIEIRLEDDVIAEYLATNNRLREQFSQLSRSSRQRWMMNYYFILTPDLRALYDKIDRVRSYRSLGQQRNFLLGGPSGSGKTTCLNWFAINNAPRVEADRNVIPIIKVDAPVSNKSSRDFLQELILQFGKTFRQRETEAELLRKLTLYIHQCNVEVIVIDEIEHLTTRHMRRHLLEISNYNQGVPIICASCHPENFIHDDPEIAGRWNDFFRLNPYTGERLRDLLTFLDLLLPFAQLSDLEEDPKRAFIEDKTQGILRDIMILITDSCLRAIEVDAPHLTLEILKSSWDDIQHGGLTDILPNLLRHYK